MFLLYHINLTDFSRPATITNTQTTELDSSNQYSTNGMRNGKTFFNDYDQT